TQVWAELAELRCTQCGAEVRAHTPESAVTTLLRDAAGERVVIAYPKPVVDAEQFLGGREELVRDGDRRLWHEGQLRDLGEVRPSELLGAAPTAKKARKRRATAAETTPQAATLLHVVTDRSRASSSDRTRLIDAFEAAFARGAGSAEVFVPDGPAFRYSDGH